ncbi:uncharacterized protein LOC105837788 isoform X2 [Monomorium pharaonis]|nr:uncharacterized protein LOC105837788 isoform X2 [Monomorium pharaonis]
MVPTVCMAGFPMAGTVILRGRRRCRGRFENGMKRRRFALEKMMRIETILPPRENCSRRLDYAGAIPDCFVASARDEYPTNEDEDYQKLVAERRKDLLSIVVRTIILVQRNRILRKRLNALLAETCRFFRSALNNPENQQRRSHVSSPHSEDSSSSTEKVVVVSTLSEASDSTRNSLREAHQ